MIRRNNNKRSFFRITAILLVLVAFSNSGTSITAAGGQSATATLSGIVADETGAVVSGAVVTVTNIGTRSRRQSTTSSEGYYAIPLLQPGSYMLRVEREGFAPSEVAELVLNVGDERSLQI